MTGLETRVTPPTVRAGGHPSSPRRRAVVHRPCAEPLSFVAHRRGRVSIGVRINALYHFKGAVAAVRFTPRVLTPRELLLPRAIAS